jgi:hypothetical protein
LRKITTSPYLTGLKGDTDLKTLGATELAILRGFVRDVLETINYDDTGVTDDLYDGALRSAEVLGIIDVPRLDEDDPEIEEVWRKDGKHREEDNE